MWVFCRLLKKHKNVTEKFEDEPELSDVGEEAGRH